MSSATSISLPASRTAEVPVGTRLPGRSGKNGPPAPTVESAADRAPKTRGISGICRSGFRGPRRPEAAAGAAAASCRSVLGGLRGVVETYSQILFGRSLTAGLLFAAATFVVPEHGAAGLLGLVATNAWARVLGRPAAHITEGYYGYNGLLVGLALGNLFRMTVPFATLLVAVSLLTVAIAAAARNLTERLIGVPVLSMPFVVATWVALLAARRFGAMEIAIDPVLAAGDGLGFVPPMVETFLRSLGAVFFQLGVPSGALVLAGLLVQSRWAAILAVVGFSAGAGVYLGLGGALTDISSSLLGFNFILSAIALGGIFVVLGPASIALAAAAGVFAAIVSAATMAALGPLNLPVLAFPFVFTTQALIFSLALRANGGGPRLVDGVPGTPEANLSRAVFRARRYPDPAIPVMHLPVAGQWKITQGPNGGITHQGLWAHAWDFEVADADGATHRKDGARREDWLAWGMPVFAPADGRVVRVVNHIEDNAIGEVDVANNWGNLVILWHWGDVYSMVCHLQKGSVGVGEGDQVVRGQRLGKVGSSGRSPVPHLHFQVQGSAEIGAPTRRAELLHYVTATDDGPRWVAHGVPQVGDLVAPLPIDDAARRAITLAPGVDLRWTVRQGGAEREERWRSAIDAIGGRDLVVEGRSAHAHLWVDASYTTVLDYEGPGDTLLGLFALGAARVPHTTDAALRWNDTPPLAPWLPLFTRLGQELLLPFMDVGAAHTASHVEADHAGVRVVTDIRGGSARVPDRIEVRWAGGIGPVALRAWRGGRLVLEAERHTEASS